MADNDVTELPPRYYRDNFLRLCASVREQYDDILNSKEREILNAFADIPSSAQCLYVRLVSRTGPWFRESKLDYAEIGATGPALDTLIGNDLVICASELSLANAARLFTLTELREIFTDQGSVANNKSKGPLVSAIEQLQLSDAAICKKLQTWEPQRIIAPAHGDLLTTLCVLFFGNRHQSLTEFVLQDIGVVNYYPYGMQRQHRVFEDRDALEEYLACAALADQYYELSAELGAGLGAGLRSETRSEPGAENLPEDLAQLAHAALNMEVTYATTRQRWYRLCNNIARDLERHAMYREAIELYSRSQRHPARERHARVLEQQSEFRLAQALCTEILANPWREAEQDAAQKILRRVQRKLGDKPPPAPRDVFSEIQLSVSPADTRVELLTAEHLLCNWQEVHYVENRLMNTLFALAFWEQIFAPVPGAFAHPYQAVPLDMYDPHFRTLRHTALNLRVNELADGNLEALLGDAYQKYVGYQCHWADWRYINADLVARAARSIPGEHLLEIWRRMLFDPRENRRGFPDLIAFGKRIDKDVTKLDSPDKAQAGADYCMIEVKGPGDALQDSQKRWLRFFQQHDIPAQVAWVSWAEAP